jgi:hypothetical protein
MHIDIDEIVNKMDGWELRLTIGENKFDVKPPSRPTVAMLKNILAGKTKADALRSDLEGVLSPLIWDAGPIQEKWEMGELFGAATAIVTLANKIQMKNAKHIVQAVHQAAIEPAANSELEGVAQREGERVAIAAAPMMFDRKGNEEFIKKHLNITIPLGATDAEIETLVKLVTPKE